MTAVSPEASRRRWIPRASCLAILLLGAALRLAAFHVVDRSPDEELWTTFGSRIAHQGPGWLTGQARAFDRDEDAYFPWPQRVGYSCLVALAMRASGDTTVRTPEALSTAASLATLAVTGAIALELLEPWTAVLAMLFLAVSPLDLALARRGWQDDVTALVALLAVWAFLRHLARGGRGALAAFFLAAGYGLVVKESGILVFGLGTLGLAAIAARRSRRWTPPLLVLAAGAATALCALGIVVGVSGGPGEFVRLVAASREALAPDDYLRHYQTGGVGYYVAGLAILQPVPFLLGAVGALLAVLRAPFLARAERSRGTLAALGVLTAVFGGAAFGYYSKNMRFLSPIYAPAFLLASALVVATLAWVRARAPRALSHAALAAVALALAVSAVMDARRFDHWFNELQMQDLATPWFTEARASGEDR